MATNVYGEIDHWSDDVGSDEWVMMNSEPQYMRPEPQDNEDSCWFCLTDKCNNFSFEFDTPYHLKCLIRIHRDNPNEETEIMMKEHMEGERWLSQLVWR